MSRPADGGPLYSPKNKNIGPSEESLKAERELDEKAQARAERQAANAKFGKAVTEGGKIFFAFVGIASTTVIIADLIAEANDGVRRVPIPVSDQVWDDVLNGKGNGSQAAFYEAVGKAVDDLMVQSGECITLSITNQEGEIIGEIHHAPERDINQSPADVCPQPEA